MTDTPTDTAPEAITQADRDLMRELHRLERMPHGATNPHEDALQLVARHRRLTSHSAGDGLREAIEALEPFADALGDDDADEPDHTEATVVCGRSIDYSLDLGDFRAARRAVARLAATPPSDAGSTTRSGGEGVRQAAARLRNECDLAANAGDDTYDDIRVVLDALATTPSLDASRDSGEGVDSPADLLAHLRRIPMTEWVWSDAERIFATLATLAPSPEAPANRQEAGE